MTFYEITDGDMAHTTGKYQIFHPVSKVWKCDSGSPLPYFTVVILTDLILLLPSYSPLSEFHQLPPVLLRRSLETLVKRGKAQIVKGEAEGVKFF